MEVFLLKALQLVLSLSILVVVHELGHFLFARAFKVRVEKFYLFFNPWFTPFKFKPKNGETEYGIGWLPLGGYCKISGMIDESMDKEQMAQPPKPYEFRSKPSGQRLLIMVAGVLFNFILAMFIYSMILFAWGDTFLPLNHMKMGLAYGDTFKSVGFEDGDMLLKADDRPLERLDFGTFRAITNARVVTVRRHGSELGIVIPDDMMQRLMREKKPFFAEMRYPMVADRMDGDRSPAALAGIQPGDTIVSIDDVATPTAYDMSQQLATKKDRNIAVGIVRNGDALSLTLHTDTAGKMGLYLQSPYQLYQTVTKEYGFFDSFPAGIQLGLATLKGYVSDMKYVFTKEGASSLGGFGTIGNLFPAAWDWRSFWMTTAFLSIILAFMNILPIPALDGGHVLFLLYEVVARRPPSDKFLEYAQIAGMIVLFGILIYANGNDLFRFFFDR
ncbi:MAG: RIP metalloprotease RseP [Tannerella sp.]|jgi:regulator of sigma E protease|nr:RIP metalloprotease RseP [Tannerella sp.]